MSKTVLHFLQQSTSVLPFYRDVALTLSITFSYARPSTGTVLNEEFDMFPAMCLWLSIIPYHLYGFDDQKLTAFRGARKRW